MDVYVYTSSLSFMLNVVLTSVITLNVVAPFQNPTPFCTYLHWEKAAYRGNGATTFTLIGISPKWHFYERILARTECSIYRKCLILLFSTSILEILLFCLLENHALYVIHKWGYRGQQWKGKQWAMQHKYNVCAQVGQCKSNGRESAINRALYGSTYPS